ncbi:cation diffusion facilitator family transporter [Sporobolomyces salmoneus]|uniref:cation diffusion facilitator family transporter n=1 Tax=Sporobolomyces salmoneus TaxID=183962 RepID=UPI00318279E9
MSKGDYVEAYDPRRSGRVSLTSIGPQLRNISGSLPSDLLFSILLSKSLLALSLHISRDWLLVQGYPTWTLNTIALGVGGAGLALWEKSWEPPRGAKRRASSPSLLYPVLFAFEVLFALFAIYRLSVFRFILLTSFAPLWARGLPFLARTSSKKAVGSSNALLTTVGMVVISYFIDSTVSGGGIPRRGYLYLLLHLLLCGQRSEILSSQFGDEQVKAKMHANGVLVSAAIAFGLNLLHGAFSTTSSKLVAQTDATSPFRAPESSLSLNLPSAALLGLSFVVIDPLLAKTLLSHFPSSRLVGSGWPLTVLSSAFVGYVGFGHGISFAEGTVAIIAWNGVSHISSTDPRSSSVAVPSSLATGSSAPPTFLTRVGTFYRHFRATIKTILASAESRRIYYFLCLNLAFMFVQMAYGIWTNSLGLISDSIHMFFDCLALAMGLFASVMANWPSNEVFTYGYSRVETLSGFANGLFLCLISIFIVFEAIQRLLDPPEMNTGQLLTVSAVGLAVNLVGMVATGHGHHGHSHGGGGGGGGHSGHGHSHAPVRSNSTPFLTNEKEAEKPHNGHSHNGHSDSPASTPSKPAHSHSHSHSQPHSHSTPTNGHAHSHATSDHDDEEDDGVGEEHVAPSGHSHNMKGVFLHVLADTLGSVGVIISTLLINRYGWTGFDPLASIFIAVLIFASVVPLVVDSGKLLVLDLGEEKEAEVRKALTAVHRLEEVSSFTRPRFWQKDPSSVVGSICIQLSPSASSVFDSSRAPEHFANIEKVTARVRRTLRSHIGGLDELTIQVEGSGGGSG